METSILSSILDQYHWQGTLYVLIGTIALMAVTRLAAKRVPTFRAMHSLNRDALKKRIKMSFYPRIQKRSKFWGLWAQLGVFTLVIPFCVTTEPQPWWQMLVNIVIILMFYDFFYYLVHRFVFHNGGPLLWVHAVHHQQKNPCREDSNYLHPIETCIGIGLYAFSIAALALLMGEFHVLTLVVSMFAYTWINLHNHDLMEADRFPFKYMHYMSRMHHVHHHRFTAGNFASITLLYDWLFGTYDTGQGYSREQAKGKAQTSQ